MVIKNGLADRGGTGRRAALVLAFLVLLAFGMSLWGEFVWDDRPLIVENRWIQDPAGLPHLLASGFWETGDSHDRFRAFFRPVVHASYALDWALWGARPLGFHLTNLIAHFLVCWLVHRLAIQEGLGNGAALLGAGLFAVHPVHVESVAWISGRTDILCALFLLLCFHACRQREAAGSGSTLHWLCLGSFALALFAKEMAATLPVLVLVDRWSRADGVRFRKALRAAAPLLATLGLCLLVRGLVLGSTGDPLLELSAESYLATGLFVVARYVTLLLLPVGLDAHYPYAVIGSLVSPTVAVSGLILLTGVLGGIGLWRRSPRSGFWLLWILITLAPVMAFGRFGDILLADRFLYIPSVGLAMLAARGCRWIGLRTAGRSGRSAPAIAGSLVLVALAMGCWNRARIWRDDITLFSDMARTSPDSALVQCNLGLALYHRGRFDEAIGRFDRAIALEPSYALAHNNLGATHERRGALEEALGYYLTAAEIAPDGIEAPVNAGNLLVRLGHADRGLGMMQEVARLRPRHPEVLTGLADALLRVGRTDEALVHLERAIEVDSSHPNSYYLLGKILFEQGYYDQAVVSMRRFLELWPEEDRYAAVSRRVIAQAEAAKPLPLRHTATTPPP